MEVVNAHGLPFGYVTIAHYGILSKMQSVVRIVVPGLVVLGGCIA
jgi:hypothetical protein